LNVLLLVSIIDEISGKLRSIKAENKYCIVGIVGSKAYLDLRRVLDEVK
jgi:hypothetical protein